MLFTVPERDEETGEVLFEKPNNEERLSVTKACHIAFKNKIIGPNQIKQNFFLSKQKLDSVIKDIFNMRKEIDP